MCVTIDLIAWQFASEPVRCRRQCRTSPTNSRASSATPKGPRIRVRSRRRRGMTDALSAMEYPHWMMVAGAVLVVFGFIGFAFSQNRNVEADDHQPPAMKANGK